LSVTDSDSRFLHEARVFVLDFTTHLVVSGDDLIVARRTAQPGFGRISIYFTFACRMHDETKKHQK